MCICWQQVPLETTVTLCKDAALQARLAMTAGATYDDIKFIELKVRKITH